MMRMDMRHTLSRWLAVAVFLLASGFFGFRVFAGTCDYACSGQPPVSGTLDAISDPDCKTQCDGQCNPLGEQCSKSTYTEDQGPAQGNPPSGKTCDYKCDTGSNTSGESCNSATECVSICETRCAVAGKTACTKATCGGVGLTPSGGGTQGTAPFCWCQKADGLCENHGYDEYSSLVKPPMSIQSACDTFCADESHCSPGPCKSVYFDASYIDRTKASECKVKSVVANPNAQGKGRCKDLCNDGKVFIGANCISPDVTEACTSDCSSACGNVGLTCSNSGCDITIAQEAGPAAPAGTCAATAQVKNAAEVDALRDKSKTDPGNWTCQTIDLNNPTQLDNCVHGGCPKPDDLLCCLPNTGAKPGQKGGGAKTTGGAVPTGGIGLPSCTSNGNCQLDDIVTTGVNFAKFLFGLSGAIFLAIFVYAGLMYLFAGGSGELVKKAQKMMVNSAIGLAIIFGASTIVRFVFTSLTTPTPGGKTVVTACETSYGSKGYSCRTLSGADEARSLGCLDAPAAKGASGATGKTASKTKNLCTGLEGKDIYCCSIDAPIPATAPAAETTPAK